MNGGFFIDIGGTSTRFGICNISCEKPESCFCTPSIKNEILSLIAGELMRLSQIYPDVPKRVAISTPGMVTKSGVVEKAIYIDFSGTDLKNEVIERTGFDVIVENDANFQSLGCYTDKTLLYMVIGTAVGGSYVDNNGIFYGSQGFAGELGHIYVGTNKKCYCGKMGCLDTAVSGKCISEKLGNNWWNRNNDYEVKKYMKYAAQKTFIALESACIAFDPAEVVLCGHICLNSDFVQSLNCLWSKSSWTLAVLRFETSSWKFVHSAACKLLCNQ